jgi:hypothetical protein
MDIIDLTAHRLARQGEKTYIQRLDDAYAEFKEFFLATWPKYAQDDVAIWALLKVASDAVRVGREREGCGDDWAKHLIETFVTCSNRPTSPPEK